MALLHIKSENQNLSYVLVKNPNSGIQTKTLKNGYLFGYYPRYHNEIKTDEYIILFKDSILETTYKPHVKSQFEYISNNQYNDARFVNDAISEMLLSAREMKGTQEYDIPVKQELKIMAIETSKRTLELFQNNFKNIEISWVELNKNNFEVTFKTNSTLSYLLKFSTVFSLFASLEGNSNFIYVEEHMTSKYLRLLNEIEAPYFVRYVFKLNMLRSFKRFEEFKPILDTDKINFIFGDTHTQRMDFVSDLLINKEYNHENEITRSYKHTENILDIGAGYDFRYLKMIYPVIENSNITYYAIERDEDAYERIKASVKNKGWKNVVLFKTFEEFKEQYKNEKVNIICSEVLEHNEKEEARELFSDIIQTLDFNLAIFTVPNKNFNKYYFESEDEFRHDDHKWEPTEEEFKTFVTDSLSNVNNKNLNYIFSLIGDLISEEDGSASSPTQSVIITKK